MSRNYVFAPGEYYHIYARGFEKSIVFKTAEDHLRFIESLFLLNTAEAIHIGNVKKHLKYVSSIERGLTSFNAIFDHPKSSVLIDIGAYCLMPNHFHILVREKDENGKGISKFMQKLMTSYTMYFNKKYDRTGALFGSSFKAQHVTNDNHLKYLFAYIHLNPKKIIDSKKLSAYQYSSYQDYLAKNRPQKAILNKKAFPDYFEKGMENEIEEWLGLERLQNPERG
jgi:putative transposase